LLVSSLLNDVFTILEYLALSGRMIKA
jgi:hypothetical protein